ncbi:MAG TPA: DUF3943 domain-containing protein [Thermodesulfobacteriota bacterium]|nr:DUF3943 domain-containing protein [Thermodesulfobacteriota bacterium]
MDKRRRNFFIPALFCLVFICGDISKAGDLEGYLKPFNTPKYALSDGYDQARDDEVLSPRETELKGLGVKEFLVDIGLSYTIWWAGRLYYVRFKNDRIFDTSFSEWIDNITQWPEVEDGDGFVTNYIYHPYFGALYYLFYRHRGHSIWASALGSAIMSTLWEYTVEGLVETPSLPDLIATPGIGIPLGIMMENLSEWLLERDNVPAKIAGYVIDPLGMFMRGRKIGILNPLTGTFEFQGPLTMTANKAKAFQFSYPFYLESPMPLGRVGFDFEVVDLKEQLGGQYIFYSIRLDFNSSNNSYGFYIRGPYAGVNNTEGADDGFEFSNMVFGGKFVLMDYQNFILSGGVDLTAPTAFKDNVNRLKTINSNYRRDFPLYLQSATTITPYISTGMRKKRLSLISNLGIDLVLNADKLEGDDFEARIEYGTAIGVTIPLLTHPTLFCEFTGYTFLSPYKLEKTDIFVTPGLRLGKRFSPGFGVQIPLTGSDADVANVSFIVDFQLRF